MQQAREQEVRASEEVVRQLLEEEQKLARSIEHQALQDEELARQIVLRDRKQVNVFSSLIHSDDQVIQSTLVKLADKRF